MNLFFRHFALAGVFVLTTACAGQGGFNFGGGYVDESAGFGVLASMPTGDDEWAELEITKVDSAEAGQDFIATNGFDRVNYDTDSSDLYWRAENALKAQARFLQENPDLTITVEGHADERGTDEYNLALGERRANAAREFLIAQGIDAFRIEVVSFGEERPVETCSDESCWSANRRSVSTIKGGGAESGGGAGEETFDLGF